MHRFLHLIIALLLLGVSAGSILAQADEVCRDQGETPSRDSDRFGRLASYVYGRVAVSGLDPSTKAPRITVAYSDQIQPSKRQVIGRTGGFCFRRMGTGGMLVLEVDGIESSRRVVGDLGPKAVREDFEIDLGSGSAPRAAPGVIDTRFAHPPCEKTRDLYKKAASAENEGDRKTALAAVQAIVLIDPQDFIAFAKLGSLLMADNQVPAATEALSRSIAIRADYTPALLNLGILAGFDKRFKDAIGYFEKAVASDDRSARAYRLLGEAYLQNRQGTLGLAALDKALEIDPIGMAECHLLKARLYDLAGAKNVASAEYKAYLKKVPNPPDKKRLEQYIKENPAD